MTSKQNKGIFGFSEIRFLPEKQFHVLKHFFFIDENYRKDLVLTGGYTEADIDKRLGVTGSKFLPDFADTPTGIINKVLSGHEYKMVSIRENNERMEVEILFPGSAYPEGIGLDCLLSIDQVRNRKEMYRMENDLIPLWCIKGIPPPTWLLNMVLQVMGGQAAIITIFPGRYAPPLPDRANQSGDLFNECMKFWENHALIVP